MKKTALLSLLIPLMLLLIPLPSLNISVPKSNIIQTQAHFEELKETPAKAAAETFRLLDTQSGEITEISAKEYIFGVLAAEMPASYETEALKAQAIAAYCFACNRKNSSTDRDYDISNDFTVDQAYKTREEAQKAWGENAEKYTKKLETVIEDVEGLAVTYNGNIALTVYHAVSSGKTEAANDIWGGDIPYLVPVESAGDRLADNYMAVSTFTEEDFCQKLSEHFTAVGSPEKWIENTECTNSGTVQNITICSKEIKGSDIRSALDLPSCNFEISYTDGNFLVTTRGYGHGVGMSQYGANIMAQQGSTYKEILLWYYTGCAVESVKNKD